MKKTKKSNGLCLDIHSKYDTDKSISKNAGLVRLVPVAIASLSTILMFESFIYSDAPNMFVLGFLSVIFTILFASFKSDNKIFKFASAGIIVAIVLYFLINYQLVYNGFVHLINRYIFVTTNSSGIKVSNFQYEQSITLAYSVTLMLVNLGLCVSLYYSSSFIGTFVITFPFFELGAYWGLAPNYLTFFIMVILWGLSLCMSNSIQSRAKLSKGSDFTFCKKNKAFEVSSAKIKRENSSYTFNYVLTLCAITTALTVLFSVFLGDRPESINELRYNIKTAINDFSVEDLPEYIDNLAESFNYSSNKKTGATNSGKLGQSSKITFSNKKVLQVDIQSIVSDSIPNQDSPLYLKGYVASYYTGKSWEEFDEDSYIDADIFKDNDNGFNFQNYGSYAIENKYEAKTLLEQESIITIKNVNANTKYLYTPYYSNFETIDCKSYYNDLYIIPNSEEYTFKFYTGLSSDSVLKKYETTSDYNVLLFDDYKRFVRNNYRDYDFELIKSAYNEIFDEYTIGDIEYQWASFDLCEYFGIDEDDELTKAYIASNLVKKYFEENFTYSLNVGKTPSSKDFVQYFLEEQKSGSCTYFASAGVLLMRAMGYPARYVEGFIVNNSDFKSSGENSVSANVLDKNGHAWCEIFITNIGWIPVEFTIGYENGQNPASTETTTSATTTTTTSSVTTTTQTTTKPQDTSSSQSNNASLTTTKTSTQTNNSTNGNTVANYNKITEIAIRLVLKMVLLLGVLFIWKVLYSTRRKAIEERISNPNRRLAVKALYVELCKLLAFSKIPLEKNKTDIQSVESIYDGLCKMKIFVDKENLRKFVELAVEADMSQNEFSDESYLFAKEFYQSLSSMLWDKLSKFKRFMAKYIKFLY